MASAVAMDKIRSKHLFYAAGISTPEYRAFRNRDEAMAAGEALGYPIFIKPNREGSSVGMSKVVSADELAAATDLALSFGAVALAERCIVGDEVTVAVLQGQALPSIRIETPRVFYDYQAKYEEDSTRYTCPGSAHTDAEERYAAIALAAFAELACSGWGRVDLMVGGDGLPQVIEINTIPGMTSHSLVPMAAREAGMNFAELCWRVLETSMSQSCKDATTGAAANDA
jgi:D-alanine-D-alanine ligase